MQILLLIRLKLSEEAAATRFFGAYHSLLEKKDQTRTAESRRQNFFSFNTPDGGVFLRCYGPECLIAEGATQAMFDAMISAVHWPPALPAIPESNKPAITVQERAASPVNAAFRTIVLPQDAETLVPAYALH
jgi:hypothetical protein